MAYAVAAERSAGHEVPTSEHDLFVFVEMGRSRLRSRWRARCLLHTYVVQ